MEEILEEKSQAKMSDAQMAHLAIICSQVFTITLKRSNVLLMIKAVTLTFTK